MTWRGLIASWALVGLIAFGFGTRWQDPTPTAPVGVAPTSITTPTPR